MGFSRGRGVLPLVGAAGAGATLMYFLDPARGARRRSLAEDRLVHAGHKLADGAGKTGRDLRNHTKGMVAAARSRLSADDADDAVIVERVRARLGRLVSHPGALDVTCEDGRVTLGGAVLTAEAERLLAGVRSVRGVREVEDHVSRHESPGNVPGLQGPGRTPGSRAELLQSNWTPAARFLTGLSGGALAFYELGTARRREPLHAALGFAGLAIATRGALNKPVRELVGAGAGRDSIDIQKTITIAAPVDEVFARFTEWERWPEWMTHVREVTSSARRGMVGERTHWVVDGVAGKAVHWDAVVTQRVANELIAWKSVDGSAIQHAGRILFRPFEDGTRVHIQMSYNPIVGAAGHALAVLMRRDPKRQMNDDLVRLKTTIEAGRPPRDAARPASDIGQDTWLQGDTPVM